MSHVNLLLTLPLYRIRFSIKIYVMKVKPVFPCDVSIPHNACLKLQKDDRGYGTTVWRHNISVFQTLIVTTCPFSIHRNLCLKEQEVDKGYGTDAETVWRHNMRVFQSLIVKTCPFSIHCNLCSKEQKVDKETTHAIKRQNCNRKHFRVFQSSKMIFSELRHETSHRKTVFTNLTWF